MFPADFAMNVVDLGRAAEERGFESLFLPEHTHIPSSRETPWPSGGELPPEYAHTLDPFVALAAVAAVDHSPEARHGHLPGHPARPDPAGQRSRQPSTC